MRTDTAPVAPRNGRANGNGHARNVRSPAETPVEAPPAKRGRGVAKQSGVQSIEIPKIDIQVLKVTVVGTSPLITHKFSDKARKQMSEKQQGKAQEKKAPKDPKAEFEGAKHLIPGKKGACAVPAVSFKKSAIEACRYTTMKKTYAIGAFHVYGDEGDLCTILDANGKKAAVPKMREDMVRVGPYKVADIRHRPEFSQWSINLTIRYNASSITPEQIAHLLSLAGFSVGVGEWRPQKGGQFGTFEFKK